MPMPTEPPEKGSNSHIRSLSLFLTGNIWEPRSGNLGSYMSSPCPVTSQRPSAGLKKLIIVMDPSFRRHIKECPLKGFCFAFSLSVTPHLKNSSENFHVPTRKSGATRSSIPRRASGRTTEPVSKGTTPDNSGINVSART